MQFKNPKNQLGKIDTSAVAAASFDSTNLGGEIAVAISEETVDETVDETEDETEDETVEDTVDETKSENPIGAAAVVTDWVSVWAATAFT